MLRFELADATPLAPLHEHRPTPGPVYYKDIGEEVDKAPASLAPLSVDVNSVFPDISEETFPDAVRHTVSQFAEPVGDDGESNPSGHIFRCKRQKNYFSLTLLTA